MAFLILNRNHQRLGCILLFVVTLYLGYSTYIDGGWSGTSSFLQAAGPKVREVSIHELPQCHPFKCVRSPNVSNQFNYVMCIKPLEIDHVQSGVWNANGMWEQGEVELMIDLAWRYPGGTFLDIGSNIGTYSVAMAATKYKTVSLDPVDTNLAYLRTSLALSGTEQYVRTIKNTLSDEFVRLYPYNEFPENEGALMFVTEENAATKPAETIGEPVDSTTFEDVLSYIAESPIIIKIDIEGYECKALTKYMNKLKKITFIPFIMMEWIHISRSMGGNCPDLQSLIKGLQDSEYIPYNHNNISEKLSMKDEKSWLNVLWVHKDAKFDHK